MSIDDAFQMIYKALVNRAIKWNDFRDVGVEEDYHDWYYAAPNTLGDGGAKC